MCMGVWVNEVSGICNQGLGVEVNLCRAECFARTRIEDNYVAREPGLLRYQ